MRYGGIFGGYDDRVDVSPLLEAADGGYEGIERSAMNAYFRDRTRRAWVSSSLLGFSLSHRTQSRIASVYDLVDAGRALVAACWHLRGDPDRMAIALRSAREFAVWREREERASPSAMPPWLQREWPGAEPATFLEEPFPTKTKSKRPAKQRRVRKQRQQAAMWAYPATDVDPIVDRGPLVVKKKRKKVSDGR